MMLIISIVTIVVTVVGDSDVCGDGGGGGVTLGFKKNSISTLHGMIVEVLNAVALLVIKPQILC